VTISSRISSFVSSVDRVQRGKWFKIIASGVVVLAMLTTFIVYSVRVADERNRNIERMREAYGALQVPEEAPAEAAASEGANTPKGVTDGGSLINRPPDAIDASKRVLEGILANRHSPATFGIALGAGTLVMLGVIWMGLGLTYLALLLLCGAGLFAASRFGLSQYGPPIVGLVVLVAAFAAIMRMLGFAFSGTGPVLGVARNVLTEAMRMKVSIIFIVLLIFGLAALPLVLDASQPLRYRMQSFMQYSTGGAFWLIAILTVLFSVSTVATEQRDRLIWQTMTKPVAAWQYVLGKWLGVSVLAAALLGVSASGVFLFVEYLRTQPAQGESSAFETTDGSMISEDRMALETQVLVARTKVDASKRELDEEAFEKEVQARIAREIQQSELTNSFGETAEQRQARAIALEATIRDSLRKNVDAAFRTVSVLETRTFEFAGLEEARNQNRPVILRYSIDTGANMPDQLYKITLGFPDAGDPGQVHEIPTGQAVTVQLLPTVINAQGKIIMQVTNGDLFRGIPNELSFTFPPDGLQVGYSTGSFQANFLRLMFVLWVKLAFLAMVGVFAGTFLSFSVASFVSFSIFLAAETSNYMLSSLEVFNTATLEGKEIAWKNFVALVTKLVGNMFKVYGDLRPTSRLVEGEHLSWGGLAGGTVFLLLAGGLLYLASVLIFRKRELAIYSGNG
jgi:ABC-type transport system involved in multi-copper enzyme maturation permease subunit